MAKREFSAKQPRIQIVRVPKDFYDEVGRVAVRHEYRENLAEELELADLASKRRAVFLRIKEGDVPAEYVAIRVRKPVTSDVELERLVEERIRGEMARSVRRL
jgi:hypothetical protein